MAAVRFLSVASLELAEAIDETLGLRFLGELERCLHLIESHPEAWGKFGKRGRRIMMRSFPYGLAYQIAADGGIVISAVIHLGSDPQSWRNG